MSFRLSGKFWSNSKVLPQGITLELLYQINDQSVWFLIWILKKRKFWPDLTREVLETPFTVEKGYLPSAGIKYLFISQINKMYNIHCGWYENGQLRFKNYWKNNKSHGIQSSWYENGQLMRESSWKDGVQDGIEYFWDRNGRVVSEYHWIDGKQISYQKK